MNIMYREFVKRRRIPVVVGMTLVTIPVILLFNLIQSIDWINDTVEPGIDLIILIIILIAIVFEILKCKVRYKYSIISDQIIIHKLNCRHENIVENIKFKDIIFIGKKNEFKRKLKVTSSKKYVCSLFSKAQYCCIYKDGNSYRKFYFEPSGVFASKVQNIVKK